MTDISSPDFAQIQEAIGRKLAEGGNFACMPATVRGVEYERVFALSNASLRDVLAMKSQEFAAKECIVYQDQRWTYGALWQEACRFANVLINEYGVEPGQRVAIAMRNYPEWCMAYMGTIVAGATVVPLNAWWKSEELTYSLNDCGAKIVVCDAKRLGYLKETAKKNGLTMILAREEADGADAQFEDLLKEASPEMPPVAIDADTDFCIMYTSGSTGKPKGVRLTHRSVLNAVLSWSLLLEVYDELKPELNLRPEDGAVLLGLPLFHITAANAIFLLGFLGGRKIVFMYQWNAQEALRLIKEENISAMTLVPTQSHELVEAAGPGDLDGVRDITTGGAKRPAHHVTEMQEKFPKLLASSGYGLTETNGLGCHNGLQDYRDRPHSTGRVIPPVTDIRIFDEEMNEQPVGEVGEVCIKSPVNFQGYLNLPEETANALTPDGWFKTGDLGKFDEDGFLYIVDRLKDLIIRGGENISCLEVENEIYAYDGVKEVTVFGLPDEKMGEIVGAVVYTDGEEIDLNALVAFLAERLAAFKLPERIWLSPQQLPRGNTGKVDKRATREAAVNFPPHYPA
jgi:acyl-CoA synthetase (AMP-forming)/AMP-acid ligase II